LAFARVSGATTTVAREPRSYRSNNVKQAVIASALVLIAAAAAGQSSDMQAMA
jgi:hypothetical protein